MKSPKAFTLIELLVVVAIIALLIALLLPALSRARDQAKLVKCGANLHAIAMGMATYNSQNDDLMPQSAAYATAEFPDNHNHPPQGYLPMSWSEALYADGDFRQNTDFNGLLDNNGTWQYFCVGFSVFQCPSHSADTQWDTGSPPAHADTRSLQGYGMAWCAVSDFNFQTQFSVYPYNFPTLIPKFSVHAKALNPGHIMVTEGTEQMGNFGGYTETGTLSYRPYLRHRRSTWGANYLFADDHVEWSDQYHAIPSPLNFQNTVATANKSLSKVWVHGAGEN